MTSDVSWTLLSQTPIHNIPSSRPILPCREPKNYSPTHSFSPFLCALLFLSAINFPIMKPANTLTNSTEQQQHHQTAYVPSVEPQAKTHLSATDVSFSSYLTPIKPDKRNSSPHDHPGSTADYSEMSIFNAQKYFNEGSQHDEVLSSSKRISPLKEINNLNLADSSSLQRFSPASSTVGYGPGYRTRSLTSSEASWNSQSGLLNARGANSGTQTDGKRGSRVIPRWLLFRPKCPCFGKKSVQVKARPADNHRVSTPKEAIKPKLPVEIRGVKVNVIHDSQERYVNRVGGLRTTPEDRFPSETRGRHLLVSVPVPQKPFIDSSISLSTGFTFPVLPPSISLSSSPTSIRMPQNGSQSSHASPDPLQNPPLPSNPPLEPLKVFMPPADEFIDSRKSQENQTLHQPVMFPIGLKYQTSLVADEGDELGSDASSDLFEIESISTQATYPITQQKQRDSHDEARPRTPSNKNIHADEDEEQAKVLG